MTLSKPVHTSSLAISIVTLALLVWSAVLLINQPSIGAEWARDSGLVQTTIPSVALQPNDVVISIDGVPLAESRFPFFEWEEGDRVALTFWRDGFIMQDELLFSAENNTPRIIASTLLTGFVALAFWAVGLFILQFRDTLAAQALPFFFTCQLIALILAIGNRVNPVWLAWFAVTLSWFITPATLHLHLRFPLNWHTRMTHIVQHSAYGLAAVSALLTLLRDRISSPFLGVWYYFWLSIGILGVVFLLVRAYLKPLSDNQRRQLGILILSSIAALAPFFLLVAVPQIVRGQELVPTDVTVLPIVLIPLGYGYALARYRVNRLEQYLSRCASVVLALCAIAAGYLLLTVMVARWTAEPVLLNLLIVLGLTLVYRPIYQRLRRFFDYLFYGGRYNYSSVISPISKILIESSDVHELANALPSALQQAMPVCGVALILPDEEGEVKCGVAGRWTQRNVSQHRTLWQSITSQNDLRTVQHPQLHIDLNAVPTGAEEVQLFVPVHGLTGSIGLLLVGAKYGNDGFGASDLEILTIVAHQTSIAFQNLQLIGRLTRKIAEAERYQRQLMSVRDEERKRIARDLHDNIIQELVGFRYLLSNPEMAGTQLCASLLDIIRETRQLCYDLRPPALDFGLIPAVRSVISRHEQHGNSDYQLHVIGLRDTPIAEDVTICLFYCVQEALANIHKHAAAQVVQISIDFRPKNILITIKDDGVGFTLPEHLGNLMAQHHFGLVGMRERIERIDGTFEINSADGMGTTLCLSAPSWQKECSNDTIYSRNFG